MSSFIDILFKHGNNLSSLPFRCTNKSWVGDAISNQVNYRQSEPIQNIATPTDIFYHNQSGEINLWLLGEAYSYKDIPLSKGRKLITEALTEDVKKNQFQPSLLNGHFVLILFNTLDKEWKVFTNRLGTYHIYYGAAGGDYAIGTFYRSVVKAVDAKLLDKEALLAYFTFGFFLNETTFVEGVNILKPASEYVFDEQLKLKYSNVYWKPAYNPDSHNNYNGLIDEFASCIETVTSDLTSSGRVAIPISGGLDSRTMAGVCTLPSMRKGKKYWSYSYGYTPDSAETSIAEKIAHARNLPFEKKVISNYLFDQIDLVSDSVELFQYIDGTRQADIAGTLATNSDYVIAAHWGDVWFDSMGVEANTGADLSALGVKKFKKRGSDWLIQNILKLDADEASSQLKEKIGKQLDLYQHIEDPDFKIKLLKTNQWSFRWTLASIRMFQPGSFPRLPFYDNRISDFFLKVPTSFVKDRKMQIDYLKRYHPDLAKITWQEFGANLYRYETFNNRMLLYRVANKLYRIAKGRKTIYRNWEIFYLNKNGRKSLEQNIVQNHQLYEFASAETLKNFVDEFYRNPNASNGYAISMLHTFSLFLKKYLS